MRRRSLALLVVLGAAGCGGAHHLVVRASQPPAASTASPASPAPAASPAAKVASAPLPPAVHLTVPAQAQLPALPNGCEITSLSMLLTAVGHPVAKEELADREPVDPTAARFRPGAPADFDDVTRWGNPEVGFVGNVRGFGYGIYHRPLTAFLDRLLPGRAQDVTGQPFEAVQRALARGVPVVVWDTATFRPTDDWVSWDSPTGEVRATQQEHAVLVVGYDADYVYVNNPLTGEQAQRVPRGPFLQAWVQLGRQAVTVRS